MVEALSHEERDRLLHIDDVLIETLRRKHTQGETPSAIISYLARIGVPKPGAIVALRRAQVMSLSDAKVAVHLSEAYAYRREADEAFEESVVRAVEEIQRTEVAA